MNTSASKAERTMVLARRLAAMLVEYVKENPGHKRAFYVEKLSEVAGIILDGQRWPTKETLFNRAFQVASKATQLRYEGGMWFANAVPVCPHCKRIWPEAKTAAPQVA